MNEQIIITQSGEYEGENPLTMEDSDTAAEMLQVAAEEVEIIENIKC